jgi:omega-amidase
MRVAALQMDIAHEDRRRNFDKVSQYAVLAGAKGVELLVLPEMFSTGFSMNPVVTAEPPDGETPGFLRRLAGEHGIAVIGGFVCQRESGRPENVALAVDRNGEDLALYAKTHLFSFMGEDRHHAAGDGPRPFAVDGIGAACFICYDLRFPELFRKVVDTCQVVFVIASWPEPRQRHWDILLQARAVENQLYVVGVNRVGEGGGLSYSGGSAVIGPGGTPAGRLDDGEGLLLADIRPEEVARVRSELPFLNDRRFA